MPARAAVGRAGQAVRRSAALRSLRGAARRAVGPAPVPSFWDLPVEAAVRLAYNVVLRREPDPGGQADFTRRLSTGELTRDEMVAWLQRSEEFSSRLTSLGQSLHLSRCAFVRSLPRAERIVDLGGTDLNSEQGALVRMGYPYPFEELVIVDLPSDERHPLYRAGDHRPTVATPLGPVRYLYTSMTDVSALPSASFGLVYSGQSIEHVPPEAAPAVLREAHRLLAPGGYLGLDTPNARVTRLQQAEFIDPDHEVEYTPAEMAALLEGAGFEIVEAKGLNLAGRSVAAGRFDEAEVAAHTGVFAEPDDCYLLAYVCRRP